MKNRETSRKNTLVEKGDQAGEKKPVMVPLLSKRSIVILGVGCLVGILIAFVYWLISPTFNSTAGEESSMDSTDRGLLGLLGIEPEGPYWSRVSVQVVNPGSEYRSLGALQQIGEYYAAKQDSLPFYQFLVRELDKQPIDFSYTVDELDKMIVAEYDYSRELPAMNITVTAPTEEEAVYLAGLLPQMFTNFLLEEESANREQQYNFTLEEIEVVKDALYEAQQDLDNITSEEIFNNPSYIALSARVDALQQELNAQIDAMSLEYLEETDLQEEYNETIAKMEDVITQLAAAEQKLQSYSGQGYSESIEDISLRLILDAEIRGLQSQLDALITGTEGTTGLNQMILAGTTSGIEYENLMLNIETTAEALAEAQKEYDDLVSRTTQQPSTLNLDYQIALIEVNTLTAQLDLIQDKLVLLYGQIINLDEENGQSGTQTAFDRISIALAEAKEDLNALEKQLGYDPLVADTELMIAQDKVNNLNFRLAELNEQLGALVGSDIESLENGYLVAGNPSVPTSVMPERSRARNVLLTGAIAGVIIAWVVLNFRWLINLVSPSSVPAKPEDEEE